MQWLYVGVRHCLFEDVYSGNFSGLQCSFCACNLLFTMISVSKSSSKVQLPQLQCQHYKFFNQLKVSLSSQVVLNKQDMFFGSRRSVEPRTTEVKPSTPSAPAYDHNYAQLKKHLAKTRDGNLLTNELQSSDLISLLQVGLAKTFTKKESEGKLSADPCSDFFFECYPYLFDTGVGADEDEDSGKHEKQLSKAKTGGGGSSSSSAGAYATHRNM